MYGQSNNVSIPDHVKAGMSASTLSVSAPVAPDIETVSDTTESSGEENENLSSHEVEEERDEENNTSPYDD